jgi:hypothetical protein
LVGRIVIKNKRPLLHCNPKRKIGLLPRKCFYVKSLKINFAGLNVFRGHHSNKR